MGYMRRFVFLLWCACGTARPRSCGFVSIGKSLAQAALQRFSNNDLVHGRKLGVWLLDPLRGPRKKNKLVWSVGLRNVHTKTTRGELDSVLSGIRYQNIVF